MNSYLMITFAAVLLAVNFAFTNVYQQKKGTSPKAGLAFNALNGLFTLVVFFIICDFKLAFTPYSIFMSTLMSVFAMIYTFIGFHILKKGSMAIFTLFLMSGGMLIPYVYGLLFLDEEFLWLRAVGIVVILAGVVLSNFSSKQIDRNQILMCIAVFILNGCVSVVSKMHQIETGFATVSSEQFVALTGIEKFLLAGIVYFFVKKDADTSVSDKKSNLFILFIIILSAIVSGVSYLLQLIGAQNIDASLLYPFITGGSVVFSTITGVIFFKDKLSLKLVLSVALCFAGTLLFL